MREDAPQREHPFRELLNCVRWVVRTGSQWRYMPHDLRRLLRELHQRESEPAAAILDGRTLRSTPQSGRRAGYDGHKRKKGSKLHLAVDTLGHLLALTVTPANKGDRKQVEDF